MNIEKIKEKIIPILKKHKAIKAGIFGSYARGDYKEKSDIDILVELNKNLSLDEVIMIKIDLEKVLKKKVDLVEYETIRPELRESILKEEVSINI
ncbi:MAG: hypothetical protein QT10_C0014G0008 [archaeon GW2011_AR19]|nr:MAG: hypothetical protein QT10_C0014G0008 [archaeon GW2011_AR19]